MHKIEKILDFAETNKPILWGLFLSTIIFKHAVANIFLLILIVLFFVQLLQNRRIIMGKCFIPILIYFFWGVVSLFWTTDFSNTIKGIGITFPLLAIPILISQYATFGFDDLKKTIKTFSICLLSYFLICLIYAGLIFVEDRQMSHFFYHSLVSVFNNNAIYISLAVAICILFVFSLPNKKIGDYFLIGFLAIFLLVLASKNIIITTFFLIVISLLRSKKNVKIYIIISAVIGVIIPLLIFLDNPIKQRFLAELHLNINQILTGQDFFDYKFSGLEVRIFQWRLMGEMIVNNQIGILGLGLHNVNYLLDQYFSYYNLYKGYFHINFHNQYLQTLGEIGFVGLALLLGVFAKIIFESLKHKNSYKILWVLLFMSSFLTESFLSRQKGVFLFATAFSLLFMHKKSETTKDEIYL